MDKTTNIGLSLACLGFFVVAIDTDVGLCNLDLLLGLENHINYIFIEVLNDAKAVLYKELWHTCVGPLVMMPREEERVVYFPKGHASLRSTTHDPLSGYQCHA
ncbi:Auxin response factor 2 [Glycine soja]